MLRSLARVVGEPTRCRLVPLNPGYTLRSACKVVWWNWCWTAWPQRQHPLSPAARASVLGLDVAADIRLLRARVGLPRAVLTFFPGGCVGQVDNIQNLQWNPVSEQSKL